MDPRTALLQQETDESKGFRNKSIGMHNLRAKLREQLKGYSHVRGFPLEPEYKRADGAEALTSRRDSMRRRNSSVSRQAEAEAADEPKYRPRRPRKKVESLVVPRLLWFSVYLSLCFVAFKGMKYFTSETEVKLCQACSGECGVLNEEFTIPVDSLGDLPFGTVFPQQSNLQCRSSMCVPGYVADPKALCRVVSDEALLYHTRRLLAAEDSVDDHNERFLAYFRSRALAETGIAGALSPNAAPAQTTAPTTVPTPATTTPAATIPAVTIPATTTPTTRPTTPAATTTPTTPAVTLPATPTGTPTLTVPTNTNPLPTTVPATPGVLQPVTRQVGAPVVTPVAQTGDRVVAALQPPVNQVGNAVNNAIVPPVAQVVNTAVVTPVAAAVSNLGNGLRGGRSDETNNQRSPQGSDSTNENAASRSTEVNNKRTSEDGTPTPTPATPAQTPPATAQTPPATPAAGVPPPTPEAGTPPPMGAPPPSPNDGLLSNGAYMKDLSAKWVDFGSVPNGGGGGCNTLQYAPTEGNGYANLTIGYYMAIRNTPTYADCCGICGSDPMCASWTRVAGGDNSVQTCYLHQTMLPEVNPASRAYNWQPTAAQWPPNPEVRYTGGVPIMFESGTMGEPLPDIMYGCPYPPVASGVCTVPTGCNCGGGVCYGPCTAPSVSTRSAAVPPSGTA